MWLSGSRFRKRIGRNGSVYLRYFAISRSIGTMLARMFLCVRTTPLGSAVAPDVKMISAVVSPLRAEDGGRRTVSGRLAPAAVELVVSGFSRKISASFQLGFDSPS